MVETAQIVMPYGVLASHVLFVIIVLALVFKNSWGKSLVQFLGKFSIKLGLAVSLFAVIGSLFYSNVIGFEPCLLCWWQRIFLYPQVFLFATALWYRRNDVFEYSVPLVLAATVVASYHEYVYLGGTSILPCTALGGACLKNYVFAFGYITIPMMSLTVSLYLLLLALTKKIYDKDSYSR